MKFEIGHIYLDRIEREWVSVKPIFGNLPTFQSKGGVVIVQAPTGRYRWDDVDHERDIISEKALH